MGAGYVYEAGGNSCQSYLSITLHPSAVWYPHYSIGEINYTISLSSSLLQLLEKVLVGHSMQADQARND